MLESNPDGIEALTSFCLMKNNLPIVESADRLINERTISQKFLGNPDKVTEAVETVLCLQENKHISHPVPRNKEEISSVTESQQRRLPRPVEQLNVKLNMLKVNLYKKINSKSRSIDRSQIDADLQRNYIKNVISSLSIKPEIESKNI